MQKSNIPAGTFMMSPPINLPAAVSLLCSICPISPSKVAKPSLAHWLRLQLLLLAKTQTPYRKTSGRTSIATTGTESSRGNVYGTHPEDKRSRLRFRVERGMTYRATETKLGAKHCFGYILQAVRTPLGSCRQNEARHMETGTALHCMTRHGIGWSYHQHTVSLDFTSTSESKNSKVHVRNSHHRRMRLCQAVIAKEGKKSINDHVLSPQSQRCGAYGFEQ
ncbi:hypothetical protein EDB82DRAFT_35425 [Fusarium venenatum]|uniref:uncharacterized protein n=1 Tax=Fusarium venenatum TaxID=56646 RepID=UPI001D4AD1AF|nr:hypothetical protein EDB82DRAFT_35425 [Fusarium venenatum]